MRRLIYIVAISVAVFITNLAHANQSIELSDLTVSITGPTTVSPGENVKVQLVVNNMGSAPAPGTQNGSSNGYMLDVVLSSDSNLPVQLAKFSPSFHEDVLLKGSRISDTQMVSPGESRKYVIEATIPRDTPSGNYCLGVVVDPSRQIQERDEGNNTTCQKIKIVLPATTSEPPLVSKKRPKSERSKARRKHSRRKHSQPLQHNMGPKFQQPSLPQPRIVGGEPTAEEYAVVRVFYATDRDRNSNAEPAKMFGGHRGTLSYGICDVSIPRDHRMGELEKPSIWKFEFREDPEKHVVVLEIKQKKREQYFKELETRITQSLKKKAFVFVHGYNVKFVDAARRTAQISYDIGFDGAPMFYSWPSQGTLAGYPIDETNIE